MAAGVHVVTPNKKLHSGPLPRYQAVRQLQAAGEAHYFYEARLGGQGLVVEGSRVGSQVEMRGWVGAGRRAGRE